MRYKCLRKKEDEKPDFITLQLHSALLFLQRGAAQKTFLKYFLKINREIFIPNREIGRFSLYYKKSGDLLPNRVTWKLCR